MVGIAIKKWTRKGEGIENKLSPTFAIYNQTFLCIMLWLDFSF